MEAVSDMPEPASVEQVLPKKRRTRAWLKYAAAALCGARLMLAALLILKKPDSSEKSSDIKTFKDLKVDYVGDTWENSEGFDFTWK